MSEQIYKNTIYFLYFPWKKKHKKTTYNKNRKNASIFTQAYRQINKQEIITKHIKA